MVHRPNGSGQFAGGWITAGIGVIASLVGLAMDARKYDGIDVDLMLAKWALIYIGGGAIGVALLLFVAGWIIEALSFLPGRDEAILTTSQPALLLDREVPEVSTDEYVSESTEWLYWSIGGIIALLAAILIYNAYK